MVRYPDLLGCITVGDTIKDALANAEDAKHTWRKVGAPVSTEAAAEAVIKAFLNITDGNGTSEQGENDGQS